jgi:hypothetical protein
MDVDVIAAKLAAMNELVTTLMQAQSSMEKR